MNTISNTTTMPTTLTTTTVADIIGTRKTTTITRFINPNNTNELIINYEGFALVINKRAWTMLSTSAPVKHIGLTSEYTQEMK